MEPVEGSGGYVVRRVVSHEIAEVHVAVGGGDSFLRHGCAGAWCLSALVRRKTRSDAWLGFVYFGAASGYLVPRPVGPPTILYSPLKKSKAEKPTGPGRQKYCSFSPKKIEWENQVFHEAKSIAHVFN
jgi:hypothetical protein